jgi:hypothetical protein
MEGNEKIYGAFLFEKEYKCFPFLVIMNLSKDSNSEPLLQIRDVNPGSEFFHPGSRVKKAPNPGSGSATKYLCIYRYAFEKMFRDDLSRSPDQDFFPSQIRIQGTRKLRVPDTDPQHCSEHCAFQYFLCFASLGFNPIKIGLLKQQIILIKLFTCG